MNHQIKKLVCAFISAAAITASFGAFAAGYYNATAEVSQIRSFMRRGMYLEVIRDSNNTIAWHNLSPDDVALLQGYSAEAERRYNDYVNGTGAYYNASAEIRQIRSFVNNGMYVEAMQNAEQTLDWHYLSPSDIATVNGLYDNAAYKYQQYLSRPKIYSPQMAINAVKAIRSSSTDNYLGIRYEAYDRNSYFLVRAITTRNANGEARYNVNKSNGYIQYLGEGSDW